MWHSKVQKVPFLCFANLFCVLQLFRSIEKPEGAHGPRERVSPQGAASKKCHTCKSTERPREHRQACLQHEQNRGGRVRGWWWVNAQQHCFYWTFSAGPIPFLARNRYFFSHINMPLMMHVKVSRKSCADILRLWCFCLQIGANISLIQPQSLWIKPTMQRPKWPPATGMALSTGTSLCWTSVPPNKTWPRVLVLLS